MLKSHSRYNVTDYEATPLSKVIMSPRGTVLPEMKEKEKTLEKTANPVLNSKQGINLYS